MQTLLDKKIDKKIRTAIYIEESIRDAVCAIAEDHEVSMNIAFVWLVECGIEAKFPDLAG
jgi:hypothetical protein